MGTQQLERGPAQQEMGFGYDGGFAFVSSVDGLIAKSGGGQAGATPLPAMMNRITTVANSGDSTLLPVARPGLILSVVNNGANPCNVFPAVGDKINALTANAAFSLVAATPTNFCCFTPGIWLTK